MYLSYELTADDFKKHPVWEYSHGEESRSAEGEFAVKPVLTVPVTSMENCFTGTNLTLANGEVRFGVLSGIKLQNPRLSKLCLYFIIHVDKRRFLFRRSAPLISGPEALAAFLGFSVLEVFPIKYDISAVAIGSPEVLRGEIKKDLEESVSRAELAKMLLEEDKRDREREMRRKGTAE